MGEGGVDPGDRIWISRRRSRGRIWEQRRAPTRARIMAATRSVRCNHFLLKATEETSSGGKSENLPLWRFVKVSAKGNATERGSQRR